MLEVIVVVAVVVAVVVVYKVTVQWPFKL